MVVSKPSKKPGWHKFKLRISNILDKRLQYQYTSTMKLNMLGFSHDKQDRENKNKELEEFINTLLNMNTKEKMRNFLEGVLTPKELLELPNRLAIVKMLKKGVSHHDVAGKLHVGVATVTRGSRELQKGRFKYV